MTPEIRTTQALELQASFVLEDGRRWGEVAEPWQFRDAAAILDPSSKTPYFYLTRPRGGSKTADLAAATLAVMLTQAPAGARVYALAADRDQGRLLLDSIVGYVSRTPGLGGLLEVSAFRVATKDNDVVLDVLAADAAGAWGLRPYFLVIDEFAQWPETAGARQLFEAARSATGKVPGSRLVILTTAGDPTHISYRVREHANADRLWSLHEVPGPVPWLSQERLEEQRRALPDSVFRRLHLNEWSESEDRLTTLDDLQACATLNGPLPAERGRSYVIGLDIGVKHDRTAAAVCHAEPLERVEGNRRQLTGVRIVVDRVQRWQGTPASPVLMTSIRDWLLQSSSTYAHARLVVDPYQATGLIQELRRSGVAVKEFTFTAASNGRLAATLHLLLRNRTIALPDDRQLLDEIGRVRLREPSPGVLRLDHDPGEHDDQAIAIALAATELLERPPSSGLRLRVLTSPGPLPRFGQSWP